MHQVGQVVVASVSYFGGIVGWDGFTLCYSQVFHSNAVHGTQNIAATCIVLQLVVLA